VPSQIFYSTEYYYPNGFNLKVTHNGVTLGSDLVKIDYNDIYAYITVIDKALNNEIIEIKITVK
jgi:hypothetical protein